ncbi:hypothetical protein EK904_008527 [Melospiza melodia maxima]|nr:hypothetical protein EK904_008527 [Melospiza melodia maxima]
MVEANMGKKNTVIKYVMGFESWEGEYTAVQLINNNGLTRVLTGCFLCVHPRCDLAAISRWKSCSSQKDAVSRTGSFLSAGVPSAPCQMQGILFPFHSENIGGVSVVFGDSLSLVFHDLPRKACLEVEARSPEQAGALLQQVGEVM